MTGQHARRRRSLSKQAPGERPPLDVVSLAFAGLRRWRLVTPILLVTLGLAYLLNEHQPAQLEARGQALLVADNVEDSRPEDGVDLAEVASELTNLAVQEELREGDTELTARARGQSLEIEVTGTDEQAVVGTVERASRWVRDNVERAQHEVGVPPQERFSLRLPTDVVPTLAPDGRTTATSVALLEEPAELQVNPHGPRRATVSLLAAIADGDDARSAVAAELSDDLSYEVTFRARDPAPVLGVRVIAAYRSEALAAYDVIVDLLEHELALLEERANVSSSARTGIERIAPPRGVVDVGPTMERSVAAILGFGGLLAIGLVLILEARDHARLTPTDEELRRGGLLFPPEELRVPRDERGVPEGLDRQA